MRDKLQKLHQEFSQALENIQTLLELEERRVQFLGRKGRLALILKDLPTLEEASRQEIGRFANETKSEMEAAFLRKERKKCRSTSGVARRYITSTTGGAWKFASFHPGHRGNRAFILPFGICQSKTSGS